MKGIKPKAKGIMINSEETQDIPATKTMHDIAVQTCPCLEESHVLIMS